ncbi:MAG: hypothetical protein SGILL_009711 [Bacillariaceae sp.]
MPSLREQREEYRGNGGYWATTTMPGGYWATTTTTTGHMGVGGGQPTWTGALGSTGHHYGMAAAAASAHPQDQMFSSMAHSMAAAAAPLPHHQVPMAPPPPAMAPPPPFNIPQEMLDNLPPATRAVVDVMHQQMQTQYQYMQTQHQHQQEMGATITQIEGDLCFMTDMVLETEEGITDREATADIRDNVVDIYEKRYPRDASPGGRMPKKPKLTEMRTSDLSSRRDLGSPHGPHHSTLKNTKKKLTEGVDPQNKKMHKAVKENMATSYTNKAREFLDNLDNLKENAPSNRQKQGYAKIANEFEDVPAKSQNYVARKRRRARTSSIPLHVRQLREDKLSSHDG